MDNRINKMDSTQSEKIADYLNKSDSISNEKTKSPFVKKAFKEFLKPNKFIDNSSKKRRIAGENKIQHKCGGNLKKSKKCVNGNVIYKTGGAFDETYINWK